MLPIALSCDDISAVVIGGGAAGTRKALVLLDAGARVRVIAPAVTAELAAAASASGRMVVEQRAYAGQADLAGVELVFAATGTDADLAVAADARSLNVLVCVASAPAAGNFASMAVHRAGQLVIGVSTGAMPRAAKSIRDAIAARFDDRYAVAIARCSELRSEVLAERGSAAWRAMGDTLVDADFCEKVETGRLAEAVTPCR